MTKHVGRIGAAVRALLPALAVLGLLTSAGCSSWSPTGPEVIDVDAQYLGLQDQRVAVVVSTSDHTDFKFPEARERITREVTRRIVAGVAGVTVADPGEVLRWQEENPYWATRPPSMLVDQLEVDRLVMIEIGEYRTHEPGDKHELRGIIAASVNVVEADAPDPDNYGASFNKTVMYPDPTVSIVGRYAESEKKIEQIAQLRFCEETAGLFFDHKILR